MRIMSIFVSFDVLCAGVFLSPFSVLAATYFVAPQLTGSTVASSTISDFTISSTTNTATLEQPIKTSITTLDSAYVASSTGSYQYTCSYTPSIPVVFSATTPSYGTIN